MLQRFDRPIPMSALRLCSHFLLLAAISSFAQMATAQSQAKALTLLRQSLEKMSAKPPASEPRCVECVGYEDTYPHYTRPRQTLRYTLKTIITLDSEHEFMRCCDTLTLNKRVLTDTEFIGANGYIESDRGDTTLVRGRTEKVAREHLRGILYFPYAFLNALMKCSEALAYAGRESIRGALSDVVTGTIDSGTVGLDMPAPIVVYLDASTHLLAAVRRPFYNGMFGDDTERWEFRNYRDTLGVNCPRTVSYFVTGHVSEESTYSLISDERQKDVVPAPVKWVLQTPDPKAETKAIEENAKNAPLPETVVEQLAPHLFGVKLPEATDMALFAECKDYVIAMDAPLDRRHATAVLKAIREKVPTKPIRYLVLGHHHPDYTGGLSIFTEQGATIVTTPGNVDYFTSLAQAKHTRSARFPSQGTPHPTFLTETDSLSLGDDQFQMKVYNIGKKIHHTDEYQVYYFPASKLLVEGDLSGMRVGDTTAKANSYEIGLYESIVERKLDVDTIRQTYYPGEPKYSFNFPMAMLQRKVERAKAGK